MVGEMIIASVALNCRESDVRARFSAARRTTCLVLVAGQDYARVVACLGPGSQLSAFTRESSEASVRSGHAASGPASRRSIAWSAARVRSCEDGVLAFGGATNMLKVFDVHSRS